MFIILVLFLVNKKSRANDGEKNVKAKINKIKMLQTYVYVLKLGFIILLLFSCYICLVIVVHIVTSTGLCCTVAAATITLQCLHETLIF